MTKRMLMDATHPEETRVAIVDSYRDTHKLEDLDYDLASKPILRGNIYLAKVMRIEPSLQAAFVDFGGNRHGFLPFPEIHPDYFRIPVADRSADDEGFDEDGLDSEKDADGLTQSSDTDETEVSSAPLDVEGLEPVCVEISAPCETTACETAPRPLAERVAFSTESEPSVPLGNFAPAPVTPFHDGDDGMSGLITDFGNAVISSHPPLADDAGASAALDGGIVDVVASEQPSIESLGGEVSERVVRHHRPRYKIQEVIKRGQIMLVQVVKEERGNKGAALTTFLSLAGRYCVLMPNTDHGGGVSRKITNHQDRRRMKEVLDQLEIPDGMAVILRTAGMEQDPPEIQRDLEYLLRLWDSIREQTLQSNAPSLIYEEANLIKRSVRDLYSQDINEILVAGKTGYERARDFMRTIMPDQVDKIRLYDDAIPLFFRYQVDSQVDTLHSPIVQLRSGGYLVINPTEALVSIDVNSGRATRERHIEETAVKTNLEAADEIARQLRLRDLAGLVVIDFIDMEDGRNNAAVERRLKEAMKNDRARLQIGRISPFGLMELSRQRLRPSLLEINYEKCPHCAGSGYVRSADSAALSVLRMIEEDGIKQRAAELIVHVPANIALYILNHKREALNLIEKRYDLRVLLHNDETIIAPNFKIERLRSRAGVTRTSGPAVNTEQVFADAERDMPTLMASHDDGDERHEVDGSAEENDARSRSRRNKGRLGRQRRDRAPRGDVSSRGTELVQTAPQAEVGTATRSENPVKASVNTESTISSSVDQTIGAVEASHSAHDAASSEAKDGQENEHRRRRRGRRGGRRRNGHDAQTGDQGEPRVHVPVTDGNVVPEPHLARHPPHAVRQPSRHVPRNQMPRHDIPPVVIPTSIYEIDTTPKPYVPAPPVVAPVASVKSPEAPARSPYEIINPPAEKQKGGWWRKLTGQE